MAENLSLEDLADSLAMLRGRSVPDRAATIKELSQRQADPLEIAIFDSLNNIVASARARKFSEPGGPNETGMIGRRFPMHALQREPDPLQEIMQHKADELIRQQKGTMARRAFTRYQQKLSEISANKR